MTPAPHRAPPRPFAHEMAAFAMLVSSFGGLLLAGEAITGASLPYTARWMLASAPTALGLGIGLQALYRFADGGDVREYLRALRSRRWWSGWARAWLACWVTSFAYFWLKVYVPRLNPGTLDAQLARADRWLHFGVSPAEWAHEFVVTLGVAGTLDAWYAAWLASVVWCLAFFAASAEPRLRNAVVLSCVLLWSIGAWMYVLFPVLGPTFAAPAAFEGLAETMPRAAGAQALLWQNYERVLAGGGAESFRHVLGIGALPSLHVGFHVLFTLWARVAAPLLFWPFAVATTFTFLGSLATGWHYAIDGYVGAALAAGVFGLARRADRAG